MSLIFKGDFYLVAFLPWLIRELRRTNFNLIFTQARKRRKFIVFILWKSCFHRKSVVVFPLKVGLTWTRWCSFSEFFIQKCIFLLGFHCLNSSHLACPLSCSHFHPVLIIRQAVTIKGWMKQPRRIHSMLIVCNLCVVCSIYHFHYIKPGWLTFAPIPRLNRSPNFFYIASFSLATFCLSLLHWRAHTHTYRNAKFH